ncbi:LLM class flavin-dependent oxidoreductase [Phytohabitans sp. ZYX-F-186]|uniref:LLM class flavin-dependent oxidoreductase n=1 Tax=Phytohabitans maris TaxID=3071409 RepID=A0ABU0ZDK3_9ACTN|nr:LLM class flavin-dependent oxidoreductase [Phytohabitans sp. ZYX-F-186]MDQ7905130.1 LLM class flavin-dependent oxidoreductase [Phytohabitans sp. ZYX-F-186]
MSGRQLHLALSAGVGGVHQGAWRRPDSRTEQWGTPELVIALAQETEAAKFDAFFLSDISAPNRALTRVQAPYLYFEPLTAAVAIARATSHIGVIATASTTFHEPYNLARQVATLDHLSGGRAGWNAVTSSVGEQNFGRRPWPDHAGRYERAAEFLDVVEQLWDSWEQDAVRHDRAAGVFADIDKIHPIDHAGTHFAVAGPLNVRRTPQGRPVIVQAGSSPAGRDLAARHASMVFTAQRELAEAQQFYRDLKSRARGHGRPDTDVAILPGVSPIIGDSAADAEEIRESLLDLVDQPTATARLADQLGGIDLSDIGFNEPIPVERLPAAGDIERRRSRFQIFADLAREERWTVRQLVGLEVASYGHWRLVGTAEQVAAELERWFLARGADGFVLMPPYQGALTRFYQWVVPLLQDRGIFRREYEGRTLRDHLGVSYPANRWAS